MAVYRAIERALWSFEDWSEDHPTAGGIIATLVMVAAFAIAGTFE